MVVSTVVAMAMIMMKGGGVGSSDDWTIIVYGCGSVGFCNVICGRRLRCGSGRDSIV